MYLFHFLRSFLPLRNPIGFGVSDFLEIAVTALLVLLALTRLWSESFLRRLAGRTAVCMFLLAGLPVALRLLILPRCPAPTLSGSDDFSYALLGDTLFHLRLANPPHPFHQFFETIFVLQEPSYSSIYPLGQGIALAFGHLVFGNAWAGVVLSVGLLCALCYWMLRAWTTPVWALAGGLLAVMEFGPLSAWMNSYWGGALSGVAGCLVFGALPRLRDGGRTRNAALLGLGIGLEVLTRPFEAIILVICALLFFAPRLLRSTRKTGSVLSAPPEELASPAAKRWLVNTERKSPSDRACVAGRFLRSSSPVCRLAAEPFALSRRIDARLVMRHAAVALLALAPALALTLAQDKAVTGNWTMLPYMLSRYQYGVPTSFTFQPNPIPHRPLTPEQELDYRAQSAIHGDGTDTVPRFMQRLVFRLRYARFFFFAPLYLAALMFVAKIREWRFAWVVAAFAAFILGTNFYPYFYPHYIAAVTCLCVLASVKGLEWIGGLRIGSFAVGRQASRLILFVCATQFLFWYSLHLFGPEDVWPALEYETWDFINYGDPEGRIAINNELAKIAGKQLVFVHYSPQHKFQEWIHNAADIDGSRVVWANDLGTVEDQKLIDYFRNRQAWLLEPDAEPPRLSPYQSTSAISRH